MNENLAMDSAKQHIEKIRKERFWIGVGKNPLSKPLRMAVKYLSAELYSKDVHFLMELIQNAEDNEYPDGVEPSLEFMITAQDITATGAPATLLIFNNEKGFSRKNMESICNIGDSTKAGNRKRGYIGEKGIGFKSVFLLTAQPYIFSNGYQIRFSETPCPECDIAYIIPEWVDSKPSVSEIQKIYGHGRTLPTTTLILPLKPDKVEAVKEQLSSLHPELLLFLSKIKRLSVKEDNMDQNLNTIRAVSISSERDLVEKKSIDAESYTVHLTAGDGDNPEGECIYYMWRQRFPVKQENKVEKRMDVDEWNITLAFPYGKRLNRGMTSVGIYAFLPTEVVTNLPFIIQADFVLPSSRETILWDDVWNQGILHCVPNAFINAFVSLVKTREDAPASSLSPMFHFLPINSSCHPKLNVIRESIKAKLLQEDIIPSESHSAQKFFHKPQEVGRLMPTFWNVLLKAKRQGVKLHHLSSLGKHILNSSFDTNKYNDVLNFLGIEFVDINWYPKCIQSCNLVLGVGEDVYVELLHFLAVNWSSHFEGTAVRLIPLLKYVDASGNISLLSIREAQTQYTLCRSERAEHISWLIDWSKEFRSTGNLVFLPEKTQEFSVKVNTVFAWLRDCKILKTIDVYGYASLLCKSLGSNRTLVLDFAHFLYLSFSKGFISASKVRLLCSEMPLLNSYGGVTMKRKGVLVPANGSNWVELMGSNPWRDEDFVELAEEYLHPGQYAGQSVPNGALMNFLRTCACASDIPDIYPPDASFSSVSGPLTKENAFLLLEWIMKLRSTRDIPRNFLSCIKNGSWLRVTISGFRGYKPPSQSFLPSLSWGNLLQSGSDMVDIPLVDERFYGDKISRYEEELKAIGVMSDCGQACEFIGKHLMSLATNYNLTAEKVFAMLNFIKFLREKYLPVDKFINTIKKVKWVRTSCGERLPAESVLYDNGWEAASAISKVPFLDQGYYGNDIVNYRTELDLLGVLVGFKQNYDMVINFLKPSASLNYLRPEPLLLALKCVHNSHGSRKLVASLKDAKCLKTNDGYMSPGQCFLFDYEWGCILEVFEGFPIVDGGLYGSEILDYRHELGQLGVVVGLDAAVKAFCNEFKRRASSNSITKNHVLSFLTSYKKLRNSQPLLRTKFRECAREATWLRTRVADFRSPKDCILYGADWQSISRITVLPFVDDSDKWYGKSIHEFRDELEHLGVLVDLEKGSELIFKHIFFPHDPTDITPDSVISLLKCIRNFIKEGQKSLPDAFLKRINQTRWLKTTIGYKYPKECLLFDSKLRSSLERQDGPFIDEQYYGPAMSSFKKEIDAIGVIIDMHSSNATSLLARHIKSQSEFARIVRIYDYLREFDWRPDDGAEKRVWVPTSSSDGMWVNSAECVLHDDHGLFNSLLHILDKHYEEKLLTFFWEVFEVRSSPSTNDYCMLWMEWGNTRPVVSHDECYAFWGHVIRHWNTNTEEMISESVAKVPAVSSAFDDVQLVNKQDVFLPDDLLLTDLFGKSSEYPLFVWCPMKNISSIPRARLHDIYARIGIRKISKSVSIYDPSEASKCGEFKRVNPKDAYIVKGLVMLILGFLSDPSLNIEVKDRHETVKLLLNVTVLETSEPIARSYSLKMGSGKVAKVCTSQMVRWERENSELLTQKLEKSGGQRSVVEYATRFSEAIAQGLLWEKEDQITRLAELIKVGYLVGFDEDAVDYYMKSKNMQISLEDEEFLASAFPSC